MADNIDAYLTFGQGRVGRQSFPQIQGEAQDSIEKDYTSSQIDRYTFGFSRSRDSENTAKAEEGGFPTGLSFDKVSITKKIDSASPALLRAICVGARFDEVWLYQRRAGGAKGKSGDYFWMITLTHVEIARLSWDGSADGIPTETIELEFGGVDADYVPQKHTGELDKGKHVEWGTPVNWDALAGAADKSGGGDAPAEVSSSQLDTIVAKVLDRLKKTGTPTKR
jgi:type VI secretion system secreted protein Hcp